MPGVGWAEAEVAATASATRAAKRRPDRVMTSSRTSGGLADSLKQHEPTEPMRPTAAQVGAGDAAWMGSKPHGGSPAMMHIDGVQLAAEPRGGHLKRLLGR